MDKAKILKALAGLGVSITIAAAGFGLSFVVRPDGGAKVEVEIKPSTTTLVESENEATTLIEDDQGELYEETLKTYEEIDGGQFEDATTGISSALTTDVYNDLGWSETYNVSSPEAFKNDTIGKCIIANNIYGAQCVSLSRVFWWSYADRDVSTCGTGMAKGMMNCYEQNAGDEFVAFWDANSIQAGDWLIFTGGQYGHVGMALGPVTNGYVALLGENQGGASCGANVGGSATNIINISIKNFIGGYRPKSYIKPEPTPEPEPEPVVESCDRIEVKKGDTLGAIMKRCEGEAKWGEAMNEYARHWYSTKYVLYPTVFDGWASTGGYGLFAGDVIEYRK